MLRKIKQRLAVVAKVARYGHLGVQQPEQLQSEQLQQITPEEIAEIKAFFPMDKFFIFGHARSGTTLLARLIRKHPEVYCNYQAHFFSRPPLLSGMAADPSIREWLARRSNRWNRGTDLTVPALRSMADFILERDARREGASIVGDKSPNALLNGWAVDEMQTFYPEARLIYIVRDGRDTLVSHRFHRFIDGIQHLKKADMDIRRDFIADPAPFMAGERSIFTEQGIRRMAKRWVRNVAETDGRGRELYGRRYYHLKYENLLQAPYETISGVWKFLCVDPARLEGEIEKEMDFNPDADYQKEVASDLVSPLEKGKTGSWRNLFTERDKWIFKQIAGQTLIDWGYESDMEW
jgi:hypothetical protein